MRTLVSIIWSILFGCVITVLSGGILYLGAPMVLAVFVPVEADTQEQAYSLKAEMESLLDVCAYEYRYDTYITRTRNVALAGIEFASQSKMLMRAEGVIKAGCRIEDLRLEDGTVFVQLGTPYVIESYVESCDIVKNEQKLMTAFDITEDKDAADRVHLQIEDKVRDELVAGAVEKTRNILKAFLLTAGFEEVEWGQAP